MNMEKRIFDKKWFNGDKILGLRFKRNDLVIVLEGEHEDKAGRILELYKWDDEPIYIIELTQEPYGEHQFEQNNLTLM